jgi:hypothetical protein
MRHIQGDFDKGETLQTMESISDEITRLRRCVRDLVALSGLPRVWIDKTPAAVAEDMVDMLRRIIRPDLVYVRLQGLAEGVRCEAASVDPQLALPPQAEEIGRALAPWLNTKGVLSCAAIPNPGGNGTLQIVVLPIGHAGEYGVVAAASRRPDFPSAEYRLLLDVSIHQAAIALQEVRLIADLRAANLVKGQWLKQEQLLRAEAEVARQQTTTILERIADRFVALDRDWQSTYRHWAAERLLQGIQRTQVEFIDKTMEEAARKSSRSCQRRGSIQTSPVHKSPSKARFLRRTTSR